MLHISHAECYSTLDKILRAYEAGNYQRLVMYEPGKSVLFDSHPAPGYVPGVQGKRQTGVEYTPAGDGTFVDIYYLAKENPTPKQVEEASRAVRSGDKAPNLRGALVSIKRAGNGNILLQMVAGNRDHIENGVRTDKVALRTISVAPTPEAGGVIVAMGLDQTMGIPLHQLQAMGNEASGMNTSEASGHLTRRIREIRRKAGQEGPQGATGHGEEVPA